MIIDPTPPFVVHSATTVLVAYFLTHYVRTRWVVAGLALGVALALSTVWVMASPELETIWRDFVWEPAVKTVSRPWDIDGESIFGMLFGVLFPGTVAYFVSFVFGAKDDRLPRLTIWKLCGIVAGFALIAWYLRRFVGK